MYPDGTEALKNITLTIPDHRLTAIIGPSGCGKTTLMKLINRLEKPTAGEVLVNGENIAGANTTELRRSIGYVIQRIGLFPHMTIEDNIALVPHLKKWEKQKIKTRVTELLQLIGLEPEQYRKKYPLELSGGQQQRIGVARALASEPDIILMDEPFSALDPISREQLQNELKSIQRKLHKTIVFVTHDMDEALKIADNIILMKDGNVIQEATPEELVHHPVNDFAREFIGLQRLEKKPLQQQTLADIRTLFSNKITDSITVPVTMTIAECIQQFENIPNDCLNIKEHSQIIGSITRQSLLNAFLQREGV